MVAELRAAGHDVLLVGVRNDTPASKIHGGSAGVFERDGLAFTDLSELDYPGDVVNLPQGFVDSLIEGYEPDAILAGCSLDATGEHMGIEEALVQAGSDRSIQTVHLVESWDVWFPRRKRASMADVYAAADIFTGKVMRSRGAPEDRIVITGHPGFDGYARTIRVWRDDERKRLGIGDGRVLVYFGQSADPHNTPDDPATLLWVIQSLQPDDRLIFSRHPRDDRDYSSVLNQANGRLVSTDWTSNRLLSVADLSLTHYSTMGLKSALLDIPTVNILLDGDCRDVRSVCGGFPLGLVGGTYVVHTRQELAATLSQDMVGRAAPLKAALGVDGGSTGRVLRSLLGEADSRPASIGGVGRSAH